MGALCSARAEDITVSYTTSQLSTTEWSYSYILQGTFVPQETLAIFFPQSTTSSLVISSAGTSDFSNFVLQPDPLLPADGEFDVLSNVANPDLSSIFSVQFVYSGSGTPPAQNFSLYDSSFSVLQTGSTQLQENSPVPEPASLVLFGSGALIVLGLRKYVS